MTWSWGMLDTIRDLESEVTLGATIGYQAEGNAVICAKIVMLCAGLRNVGDSYCRRHGEFASWLYVLSIQ